LIETRIVLTTTGTREEAEKIAHHLVENRLAACVNLLEPVQSIYRWEGKVEEAREVLLIIKTEAGSTTSIHAAIRNLHSYDLPEFLVLTPEEGGKEYMAWIASSLRRDEKL
jgi:periplasmic divalent cation tolerance protein